MSRRERVLCAVLLAGFSCGQAAQMDACRGVDDDSQRLACYDAAAGRSVNDQGMAAVSSGTTNIGGVAQTFATAWELTDATKRGTFVVRTYEPTFVLPAHYSSSIDRSPTSPTHPLSGETDQYKPLEAKIQISLRTKVLQNLLLPDADLWFAYTQRSMWQVWDSQDSAPFRSTDYQPEALYVIPVPAKLATLPAGWRWDMVQLGLAHQSNGQSDPLSRSWNRLYVGASLAHGELGIMLRENFRFHEALRDDDNPDLTHYIGTTEMTLAWLPGRATAALSWHVYPGNLARGALQADWTYPVHRAAPQGLRWYLQLFSGYGETLLDYNHRQNTVGLGVTLFQL